MEKTPAGCLKEFLCVVRHDRKFFLPETGRVLRRSVRDLEDFTAQNAIVAFETISQYANNLFAKPWRKEYRTLKVCFGFIINVILRLKFIPFSALRPIRDASSTTYNRASWTPSSCFWPWAIAASRTTPSCSRVPFARIR